MSRLRHLGVRLVQSVVTVFLILTFLFFFFRLLPGDFLSLMVYQGASPETVAELERQWGLHQPIHVQYVQYMVNLLQLDAGVSLQFQEPVWDVVRPRLINSFILVAPGITVGYLIGSTVGAYLGAKRGTLLEKIAMPLVIFSGSFPSFFIAIVLIIVFAGWLGWFPTSGMFGYETASRLDELAWWEPYFTRDFAYHYVLPFSAVVIRYFSLPVLMMRTSVSDAMDQDFFYYYRLTGLPSRARLKKILKHGSLPVITLYPISMTRAIGGLVLIETVFNWPGIGFTVVQAVLARDIPLIQFVFFMIAVFVVAANFLVDVLYKYIDPRVDATGD